MLPVHRAKLAAAITRFQADLRRLARSVPSGERDRVLTTLDPARARSAAVAKAGTRKRAAAAPRKQPAARARPAAAGTRARQVVPKKRTRKPDAARTRVEPTAAESAVATTTTASMRPAATEAGTEPMRMDPAGMGAAPGTPVPAAAEGTRPGPTSVTSGSKRVRWTRETIIDELARWMVAGTSIDASFLKRHGPPGLVSAALRIFGRFDAALNVAGLQVAKLYPDGPPGR
jgi:hypothetical protein